MGEVFEPGRFRRGEGELGVGDIAAAAVADVEDDIFLEGVEREGEDGDAAGAVLDNR